MVIVNSYSSVHQEQIIQLILDIQNEFGVPIIIQEQPDLLNIPNFYQKNKGGFWIAIDNDIVIGTIALLDIANNQAVIRKMFVHKDFRGKSKGVGQLLLDTLLNWAKEQAMTTIYLGTTENYKAAHRFYEKNRFLEITKAELPPNFSFDAG